MQDFVVLGSFKGNFSRLRDILGFGLLEVDVRSTARNRQIQKGNDVLDWHSDTNFWRAIVLWADNYPTEVKLPNGEIVAGDPNDVVYINNDTCKHRMPVFPPDTKRNFVRVGLPYRPSAKDINSWKKALDNQG